MTPHLADDATPAERITAEDWFRGFVPPSLRLPPDRACARGVTIRNRQLARQVRFRAEQELDCGLAGFWMLQDPTVATGALSPIGRARAIRRLARRMVNSDAPEALDWIRRARSRRTR